MRIMLSSGGTGGHVYPALAVAESLRELAGDAEVHLVGTRTGLEAKLFAESALAAHYLVAKPLPARKGGRWVVAAACMAASMVQASALVRRLRPSVVIGTGGYASVPVVTAAQRRRVPTLVHEMDAHPGRANQLLAGRATRVTVGFAPALDALQRPDGFVTGNPLRGEFASPSREHGRARLGLPDDGSPVVLVMGGSRGAVALNAAAVAAARALTAAGARIVLVTGRGNLEETLALVAELPETAREGLHVLEYLEGGVADALAAADVAVTRAGAATISELAAVGLPAVLVPYPYATGQHQRLNAEEYAKCGAALALAQADAAAPGALEGLLGDLLKERHRLSRMAQAARAYARPRAAADVARLALELVDGAAPAGR
jgi:UDP-N-acetylglucosamine--N-acetylmuramyl-(pentapeptide) pyrophosphoryl-undecaprenol N-acetylglucosamine transferase